MPESSPVSQSRLERLALPFLRQLKPVAVACLPRIEAAETTFRKRLKQLGFEKADAELLIQMTAGAAVKQAAAGKNGLKVFLEQVASGARELAKRNVPVSSIADVLREYTELVRSEDESRPDGALEASLNHLELAAISQANTIYNDILEAEKRVLFALHRAIIDSSDPHRLMRYFIESIADFFGASAGHIFLVDEAERSWQLEASTGKAVSRKTRAGLQVTRAVDRTLQRAMQMASSRPASAALLDPGWNAMWRYFWSVPVVVRGAFSGVVQLAFAEEREMPPRDVEVLSVAAERTVATAKRFQLIEDIAAREERVFNLARRMLRLEEIERRRISRELHDDAGQSLVVIRLQMEMLEQSLPAEATEVRERLKEIRDLTEATILNMRRLISDLSPAVLEQLGLAAGLRQLINRFRGAYPCKLKVQIGNLPEMDHDFEMVVYRLAQECLNNISRHSQAKSVNISVTTADKVLRLRVQDDGIGFDVEQCVGKNKCFGLVGMRERVILLGGSCDIRSMLSRGKISTGRKNPGTEVDIQLSIPGNIPSATPWDVVR